VEDAAPVMANTRCAWPVSGRLTIQRQEPALAASLDFGDGTCDSKAVLTVAGRRGSSISRTRRIDTRCSRMIL
jgi:hypothetical protein